MIEQTPSPDTASDAAAPDVKRTDHASFDIQIKELVDHAEAIRMDLMKQHQGRNFSAISASIVFVFLGAVGFGWYLLVEGRIDTAVMCVMLGIAIPVLVHLWAEKPLTQYEVDYKEKFMPKLAKVLGGFKFYPKRGISGKIIAKTGVVPRHEIYKAEDCFMGTYKGVKVIFSEARLYPGKRIVNPVFDGIFVLLETPEERFKGHSILSMDKTMVSNYAARRWKSLQAVSIGDDSAHAAQFSLYSDQVESAAGLAQERLLNELAEASNIFNEAPITTVFFRKKYIFLMIPYAHDMFEASNIHIPVKTQKHALQCKKEIEQILEIIDVFDLYKKGAAA